MFQFSQKVLIEAVNSIELIHPSRSTIQNDNVSSCAFIPMEVVIKDLVDLNWQECTVTSLQTLNFMNYNFSLQNSIASTSKRKPKRSRKDLPRLEGVVDADTAIVALAAAKPSGEIGGTRSACSVAVDYQCGDRKRKMKSTDASMMD